jgi:hypothetical protein
MPIPFVDPCAAVDAEIASFGLSWSQARDRLERWRWDNNCPNKVPPTSTNWGKTIVPPLSSSLPPNPDDRQPPQPGN